MSVIRSVIAGVGGYLPERIVTNQELSQNTDTNDSWIVERTGIRQRHFAAEGELTSHLATMAARQAIVNAGIDVSEIDLIVLATATPDNTFPATATRVQAALGVRKGAAFDIQAVCSGFLYAINIVDNFIKTGQSKCAIVIGAETFSRILDHDDRGTCILFGDGAGALLLRAEQSDGKSCDRGILSTLIYSDGRYYDSLKVDGGPSSSRNVGHLRMEGREVFRHAVNNLSEVVKEILAKNDVSVDAVRWVIPHQANRRILDSVAHKLSIPIDKFVVTVDHHANTSAASVPLAFAEAVADGRIKKGDLLVLNAMGGGFTWGATLLRM